MPKRGSPPPRWSPYLCASAVDFRSMERKSGKASARRQRLRLLIALDCSHGFDRFPSVQFPWLVESDEAMQVSSGNAQAARCKCFVFVVFPDRILCEAVQFPIVLVYLDRRNRVVKMRSHVRPGRLSACLSAISVVELPTGTVRNTLTKAGDVLVITAGKVLFGHPWAGNLIARGSRRLAGAA
jgi:hypothetical protein